MAGPVAYKLIMDHLQSSSFNSSLVSPNYLTLVVLGYMLLRIAASALNEMRDALFHQVEQSALRHIASRIFDHFYELDLKFHLNRHMGSMNISIQRGVKSIEGFFRFLVFNIFPTLLEIVLVCGVLAWMYPVVFAIITFITLASYVLFTLVVANWRIKFLVDMNQADNLAHRQAMDGLLNYTTVKSFGNEARESEEFKKLFQNYSHFSLKNRYSLCVLNFGQAVIMACGLGVEIFIAADYVRAGMMTLGDFSLINIYLIQVYTPLNMLGFAYREIKQALLNMTDMFVFLDKKPAIQNAPEALSFAPQSGGLVFQNVSFCYEDNRSILTQVSFNVPPHKTVAIVGGSGGGKSTILNLIYRFFDPQDGQILIDGQNIKHLTLESFRRYIAVVSQDITLFHKSIAYNIGYGDPTRSFQDIENAAKKAHIHTFIKSLPQGYETLVGERGLRLSGGEKQRIAIARAFLKKPLIFLFDEATSALDNQTERAIQKDLRAISKNHTTVVVAHRLSTIVDVDEIIVLEKGRVVEQGTHHELLRQEGAYALLWKSQEALAPKSP